MSGTRIDSMTARVCGERFAGEVRNESMSFLSSFTSFGGESSSLTWCRLLATVANSSFTAGRASRSICLYCPLPIGVLVVVQSPMTDEWTTLPPPEEPPQPATPRETAMRDAMDSLFMVGPPYWVSMLLGSSMTIESTLNWWADRKSTAGLVTPGPGACRNVVACGAFGFETGVPVIGVARSGKIVKNWSRSKKNGSARAPQNTVIPRVGENVVLSVPVVA